MAETDKPKSPIRLNVRFDDDKLRSQVEAAAKSSLRTLNAEIVYRLKTTFAGSEKVAA